jgi:hypothetical protein
MCKQVASPGFMKSTKGAVKCRHRTSNKRKQELKAHIIAIRVVGIIQQLTFCSKLDDSHTEFFLRLQVEFPQFCLIDRASPYLRT